jgi:hypothetical protein
MAVYATESTFVAEWLAALATNVSSSDLNSGLNFISALPVPASREGHLPFSRIYESRISHRVWLRSSSFRI